MHQTGIVADNQLRAGQQREGIAQIGVTAQVDALRAGKPADTSAEDNLKTFALVEAAYGLAGKERPEE